MESINITYKVNHDEIKGIIWKSIDIITPEKTKQFKTGNKVFISNTKTGHIFDIDNGLIRCISNKMMYNISINDFIAFNKF